MFQTIFCSEEIKGDNFFLDDFFSGFDFLKMRKSFEKKKIIRKTSFTFVNECGDCLIVFLSCLLMKEKKTIRFDIIISTQTKQNKL